MEFSDNCGKLDVSDVELMELLVGYNDSNNEQGHQPQPHQQQAQYQVSGRGRYMYMSLESASFGNTEESP